MKTTVNTAPRDMLLTIPKDTSLRWIDVFIGRHIKNHIITFELEQGAAVEVYGLFMGTDDMQFEIAHKVMHRASHSSSKIASKGVLNGSAHAIYNGLIQINPSASASKARQSADVLLLSPNAKIEAVPDLDIANKHVECSHGVTTTNINKEKLFYLQSRGIEKKEAIHMSVMAHIAPIIEVIPEKIRGDVLKQIERIWT